ncbi:hypothetical protein AJ79_10109 [Helicocarpus griseus UAMH5409]|uniref:PNPLA domain-containing protein n=1 Tax=Helicocarpus griseus UAMH5409 TaxID=1447875 RepID=A0A2B7WFI8_9EURO|nr:hypothetical protein AJ79_10109 [Helicocarpus griseus UAMH5409]
MYAPVTRKLTNFVLDILHAIFYELPLLFTEFLSAMIDIIFVGWNLADKLHEWWFKAPTKTVAQRRIAAAESFEEWEAAAVLLDKALEKDVWRGVHSSSYYDYRLIRLRIDRLVQAKRDGDVQTIVQVIRSGLLRNLVNILSPQLYEQAHAGTKRLIEDYISEIEDAIEYVATLETVPLDPKAFDSEDKLRLLHDTRQAYGRSTLVLQGGAIFGTCHLGIVKALFLRGLLPRIITGTATGALVAVLVGIHTDDELLPVLDGEGIDQAVFHRLSRQRRVTKYSTFRFFTRDDGYGWLATWIRRLEACIRDSYFPDLRLLEEYVKITVGHMTFEEAYAKTKRTLNITIPTPGRRGVPNLLNYITAPNVLIWSAAVASNVSSATSSRVTLYCKDETGAIAPWPDADGLIFKSWRQLGYNERERPLSRLSELFNVNHFIVAQARPCGIPIFSSEVHCPGKVHSSRRIIGDRIRRVIRLEFRHWLRQLDRLGLLPTPLRRLFIYEDIPGSYMTILPEVRFMDMVKMFHPPTVDNVKKWILRGERGTWPAIAAVRVRCAVELALERGYQVVIPPSKPGFGVGDE